MTLCPSCQQPVQDGFQRCPSCGVDFPKPKGPNFSRIALAAIVVAGLLAIAILQGPFYLDLVRSLLKPRAVPTANEALLTAAGEGRLDEARDLIAQGTNVNARNGYQDTPLHWAAIEGHRDVAELLLEHGALVDPRNNSGVTPLHLAIAYSHRDVAEALIAHGADVNAIARNRYTPLMTAEKWPEVQDREGFVALLKNHGAGASSQDTTGEMGTAPSESPTPGTSSHDGPAGSPPRHPASNMDVAKRPAGIIAEVRHILKEAQTLDLPDRSREDYATKRSLEDYVARTEQQFELSYLNEVILTVEHARAGDFSAAMKTARSIQHDGTRSRLFLTIVSEQIKRGDPSGASRTVDAMSPDSFQHSALAALGKAYAAAGNQRAAGQAFRRALELGKTLGPAYLVGPPKEILIALAESVSVEQALKSAADPRFKGFRDDVLTQIAILQAKNGDVPGAKRTVTGIQAEFYKLRAARGIAAEQARAGDVPGAMQTANAIGNTNARNAALLDVAGGQAQSGDLNGALRAADALYPGEPGRSSALWWIAEKLAAAGKVKEAQEIARMAQPVKYHDASRLVNHFLGNGHVRQAFQFATAIPPGQLNTWTLYRVAMSQAQIEDVPRAHAWAVKLEPAKQTVALIGVANGILARYGLGVQMDFDAYLENRPGSPRAFPKATLLAALRIVFYAAERSGDGVQMASLDKIDTDQQYMLISSPTPSRKGLTPLTPDPRNQRRLLLQGTPPGDRDAPYLIVAGKNLNDHLEWVSTWQMSHGSPVKCMDAPETFLALTLEVQERAELKKKFFHAEYQRTAEHHRAGAITYIETVGYAESDGQCHVLADSHKDDDGIPRKGSGPLGPIIGILKVKEGRNSEQWLVLKSRGYEVWGYTFINLDAQAPNNPAGIYFLEEGGM